METGTVKWFNEGSGYGFIASDDGGNELFVRGGSVEVRGLAWSGDGNISKVEYSSVGGTIWHDADLSPGKSHDEWVLWRGPLELSHLGPADLVCRATDTQGHTQPERRDTERLDGYGQNWYHRVQVVVV